MDYFINPIWFYWLGVWGGLKVLAILLSVLAGCALIGFIIGYVYNIIMAADYDTNKDYLPLCRRGIRWSAVVFIPLLLIAIFAPDKQTLIGMQVASVATKTNAEWTVDQLKDVVDYIFERINSVK